MAEHISEEMKSHFQSLSFHNPGMARVVEAPFEIALPPYNRTWAFFLRSPATKVSNIVIIQEMQGMLVMVFRE